MDICPIKFVLPRPQLHLGRRHELSLNTAYVLAEGGKMRLMLIDKVMAGQSEC
ncbi:MAG: hypothetical protein ONA90_09350 [candidate division KSB1 bacterium]|nr:hypothetical protein [candidate division KSB1 bacterium]